LGAEEQRIRAFAEAFADGIELAEQMECSGELGPPNTNVWKHALSVLIPWAAKLPAPLVAPLQSGGVSVEWHDHGLNIEMRFRGLKDVFAVIEDASDQIEDYFGRDPNLERASVALDMLASRMDETYSRRAA
jgi:hypothetical protein